MLYCRQHPQRSTGGKRGLVSNILTQQEREEAQRLFDTNPEALTADRTFEPGEGLAEAEGPAEDEEMAAVPEPTTRKGPTPEQITAIKVLFSCFLGMATQTVLQHAGT